MIATPREQALTKLESMEGMPSIPAILEPLLRYLSLPLDQMEVQKVVDMISHDKSLTVQCLHFANSPLYCRWQAVDSLRGAVMALGLGRMKDEGRPALSFPAIYSHIKIQQISNIAYYGAHGEWQC